MIHRIVVITLFWRVVAGLPGCTNQNDSHSGAGPAQVRVNVQQIQNDMVVLNLAVAYAPTPAIASYFKFYGMHDLPAQHFFGYFRSQSYRISAHVFIPQRPAGSMFLLHGYLDHAGALHYLIQSAVAQGLAVAVFDLPGHGLSSGERGVIDDFNAYVETLEDFIARCEPRLPEPYYLVGHSTGAAIALKYLQRHEDRFDKIVLLAPLVHHANWRLSKIGVSIAKIFGNTLPRTYRENSSDSDYLAFVQNDPLQGKRLSIAFLNALYAWEEHFRHDAPVAGSVLLIQGSEDIIVDWRYNVAFLRDKIQGVTVEIVDGARHQLMNEAETIRTHVFHLIFDYLDRRVILWRHPDMASFRAGRRVPA
jgi:alpha-beta hydrolase superfamily lysophospholipase